MNTNALNTYLDAAILKPELTIAEVEEALQICRQYEVFSACVRPADIQRTQAALAGSSVATCVVLGFPHGCQLSASKADEARRYRDLGVDEIDMVAAYGMARSGQWDAVRRDIEAVAAVTGEAGIALKVIFETACLDASDIAALVEACIAAGAQFVKTSTGFNGEGAREEDVRLMLQTAKGRIKVKPSGGIRDAARARLFVNMGVDRLGVGYTSVPAICSSISPAIATDGY